MKTMLTVKTDSALKKSAQGVAKDLGLPLGTIVNAYLRELVATRYVAFTDHPMPNAQTRKILDQVSKDIKNNKNLITFKNDSQMDAYLLAL